MNFPMNSIIKCRQKLLSLSLLALTALLLHPGSRVSGHLNVFLNPEEVMRLLGVSAEVYYVREGLINNYALNFIVPVPANVRDISFTWQSLAGRGLPYSINVVSSDPEVLPRPSLNVSHSGEIPTYIQTWAIELRCSGVRAAEVDVSVSLEVVLNRSLNNVTHLVFRRKKICLLHESEAGGGEQQQGGMGIGSGEDVDDPLMLETVLSPPTGLITLVVGVSVAMGSVCFLLMIAYCVRGAANKRQQHQHGGQLMRTSSFQRLNTHPTLHPCQASLGGGSGSAAYMTPSMMAPLHAASLPRKLGAAVEQQQHPEELHRRISELTVERCRVRLSSLLQEGTFGRVYRGTYNDNQDVLVKTVAQHASQMQVLLLLQEGMLLYGASHPGILSVLGVSIEDHTTPFVLYPAPNNTRNLKLFLLDPACARTVTTIQIVMMASQLSMALDHLHSHGVVHKDIATRNCVIDDQLRVKLSDSSLSRDLFPSDYNCLGDSENRPVKWMSLEALQHKQFSEASDSWAFGVLMWELCTSAKQPYAEVDPFEMEHYLKDGYRLAQPFNCPDELFTIMAYCWALLPGERPTFAQLQSCLSDFYTQITRYV
ncbi:tyrosine-protein kinase Dnt [Drosophila guanche]|uniref:receptor protein-tyrosine kinase n=1 Tax=Drosophila guanche TaxID=7266 RepID=A0A3B0KK39_DROGU|nr:tyrosine-protein kinase Dnt [Drosophila guanche]SPP85511.1 blast:Tyrosine-protein kinase Dnt [Drosophila guanche]